MPVPIVRQPGRAEVDSRRFHRRQRLVEVSLAITVPVVLVAVWEWGGHADWYDTRFFPRPSRVWTTGVDLVRDGELPTEIWRTTKRILAGYALGVAVGFLAGVLLGMSRLVRAALEPTLNALYTVPKLALLPAFLLLLGTRNDNAKIALIAVTVFFFMWISTMAAIMTVSEGYREALVSFGANPWQLLRHVLLPASLPQVFVAMRLSAGVAVLSIVGVEFVTGGGGMGSLIWKSWQLFLPAKTYVGIVTVALMGLVFSVIVQWIGRRLTPWAPSQRVIGRQ
jgi:sulfonate transport system permease protein